MTSEVKPRSIWQHYNGLQYRVVMLTNCESSKQDRYPTTVVYANIKNGNVYSRPLSDWHRSMTWEADEVIPDVPELVRYDIYSYKPMEASPNGLFVLASEAAAIIEAQAKEIERLAYLVKVGEEVSAKIHGEFTTQLLLKEAAEAELAEIKKQDLFDGTITDFVMQYGGRCRDCADNDGACPNDGVPCDPKLHRSTIKHAVRAIAYGISYGFLKNPFDQPVTDHATTKIICEYLDAQTAYNEATRPSSGFGHPKQLKHSDPLVLRYREAITALRTLSGKEPL